MSLRGLLAEFGATWPSEGSWKSFWAQNLRLPGLVFCLGLAAALALGLILVKVHLKATNGSTNPAKRLWIQLAALGGTNVMGIFLGFFYLYSSQSHSQASLVLTSLASEAWKVADMTSAMNVTTKSFAHNLDRLYSECPKTTHEFLGSSIAEQKGELHTARNALAKLDDMLQDLPGLLAALASKSQTLVGSLAWCQLLPLAGLMACLVAAAVLVFIAEYSGPKLANRCRWFQLPCLASALIVPVLVLVAGCAAAELLLAVLSSAQCSRPEMTVLNYARGELGRSAALNLTAQYVGNATKIGAIDDIHVLHMHLSSWDEWVTTYGEAIERSCPAWDATNVSQNLRAMITEVRTASDIMQPTQMAPQWTRFYNLVCGAGISEVFRIFLVTLLQGFVFLPLLACSVSCLLEHLVAERGPTGHGYGYAFNRLSTEDADQSS